MSDNEEKMMWPDDATPYVKLRYHVTSISHCTNRMAILTSKMAPPNVIRNEWLIMEKRLKEALEVVSEEIESEY